MFKHLSATRLDALVIKHIIAPVDRFLYRPSGDRIFPSSGADRGVLLLTMRGRLNGKEQTTPLYYLRVGSRIIVCNVNPVFERANPWGINLGAYPIARLQIGPETGEYNARDVLAFLREE